MNIKILQAKPKRMWEWREYKSGSLIENGVALNEMGTFIWKRCDGKTTVDEITDAILRKFDVKKAKVEKDTIKLIQLLVEENALKLIK